MLIAAATSGKIDRLYGLKENVILGRKIPVGTGYRAADKDADASGDLAQAAVAAEDAEVALAA